MPIDAMTLRQAVQTRPDLAQLLGQGTAAPTQATAPTVSGFMPESLTGAPAPAPGIVADDTGFTGGLWDRVKGFFDPDEEVDQAQQAYDADVASAGWAGAAGAAADAASNPQLSPIQVLTQALAGYSGAKTRARGELRSEAQQERLFGLRSAASRRNLLVSRAPPNAPRVRICASRSSSSSPRMRSPDCLRGLSATWRSSWSTPARPTTCSSF